jgi:membrane associated rhomboid family serine protease
MDDISFDSVVTYRDFSFDDALAQQTKFQNVQGIKIGLLDLENFTKPPPKSCLEQPDSSFSSTRHIRFKSNGEESQARSENCFQSVILCTCPSISWCQFITIVSLIEAIIFVVSISVNGLDDSLFLAPNPKSIQSGWSDPKKIKQEYQVWRFISPTFIHGSLEHLVGNLVFQLYIGIGIESGIGPWRMLFLHFVSAIGGITLSMCVRPTLKGLGASTAIFGLIGFYI